MSLINNLVIIGVLTKFKYLTTDIIKYGINCKLMYEF